MTHSDIIWQILSALAVILTVIATYLRNRSERKVDHKETTAKIEAVQSTVDGQADALHARADQLTASLADAGVEVPPTTPKTG